MKKFYLTLLIILFAVGFYLFQTKIGTVNVPAKVEVNNAEGEAVPGITTPEGFRLSIFAKDLPGARVIAQDSFGNLWVSQTSEGMITKLEVVNGKVANQTIMLKNLDRPHGLVIDNNFLYFAEETKITKLALESDDKGQKIADLPGGGGGHYTRTLLLGPDDRLYVSIGSTCNVCAEKDARSAAIYSMNKDGTDFKKIASGLRNAVFMAVDPVHGKIFATEMGRDNLGDNLPPDEINIIENNGWYGWPWFYGKNIEDMQFSPNARPSFAQEPTPSFIDLPAHSAPLGLAFIPEEGWEEKYWYNLLVAYHGSWNRSIPTGYKIVRLKMNSKGEYLGSEDFITGWLADGKKSGRPVDIKVFPGGVAYITDDSAGVIYRLARK